jgi:hypothetical protein
MAKASYVITIKDFRYLRYEYNELHCKNCKTVTVIENSHYKTDEKGYFAGWELQFQCQLCGKLKFNEEGLKPIDYVGIPKHTTCDCGGQLRRDTRIFCPNCLYDKTKTNIEIPKDKIVYNHRFDMDNTIQYEDLDAELWMYSDKRRKIKRDPF